MERAVFLVEATGERISCLLNPDSVVLRRRAGVVAQPGRTGRLGGRGLADDPLLLRGGGRTEVELALLFDVSLLGSDRTTGDVRELTAPLWQLTEEDGQNAVPSDVLLIWGKTPVVRGVIESIAERLERFTAHGAPQRSWVRCRILRREPTTPSSTGGDGDQLLEPAAASQVAPGEEAVHEVVGGGGPDPQPYGERLDSLAARYYGDPTQWRRLAEANDLMPPWPGAGTSLRVPGPQRAGGDAGGEAP